MSVILSCRSGVSPHIHWCNSAIERVARWTAVLLVSFSICHATLPDTPKLASTRQTVSFDFGWKHRTGLRDWAGQNDLPPINTDPGVAPEEASPDYDDNEWLDVQLPHDALIVNPPSKDACPDGCSGRSYIPRHVLWYRKTFSLPQQWLEIGSNNRIFLEFQGSFRNTTVWLNGQRVANHICGYTPFRVDLSPEILRKDTNEQTIAVYVDPDNGDSGGRARGSGWWYEGGGLYRHVTLTRTNTVYVVPNGLFVKSQFGSAFHHGLTPFASMQIEATIFSDVPGTCVSFYVQSPSGETINTETQKVPHLDMDEGRTTIKASVEVKDPVIWTSFAPLLYRVQVVLSGCSNGIELDKVSVDHGIRKLNFDPSEGFFLNDQHYKIRGFCDHDTFAVVGMAVPDRVNLFRAQASRSVGGNGRRASHNPPDPTLLEIYDRLGMVVIDENRLFDDNPDYVENMKDLVKRDRNHPSVIVWSFCNEQGCEGEHEKGGPSFQKIVDEFDGSRPSLANMWTFNDLLSDTIDIQGFSHRDRDWLDKCHASIPDKPIFMSECCSCNTMRGEDEGCETSSDNPHYDCDQKAFNARCLGRLVNASDGIDYAVGTMVWTLFDYYGEPPSRGLTVSSTYGQFDLCGFPKSAAFWFRTQWLLGVTDDRVDKTFPTQGAHEVHIVESWEAPIEKEGNNSTKTKSIHAYSNAPFVELFVNGQSQGALPVVPMVLGNGGSYAEWNDIEWKAGNVTAIARSFNGTQVATTSRATSGQPFALDLRLDCPSSSTGTGNALFLDGHDVGLIRASIVDSSGQIVHLATNNITFSVVSGPGQIQGTANGDPKSYQPHVSASQSAYHGLVRAVVRVTSIAGLSGDQKTLLSSLDTSMMKSRAYPSQMDKDDIIIKASSPGLKSVQIRIPTSTDPADAVLAVAERNAGKPVDFFNMNLPILDINSARTDKSLRTS